MKKRRWLALLLGLSLCLPQWGAFAAPETPAAEEPAGSYIVKLSDGAPQLFSTGEEPEEYLGFGMYLVDEDTAMALAELGEAEFIEEEKYCTLYAEPRYSYPTTDRFVRNKVQWNLEFMNVGKAWAAGLDGTGTTVAVIDSGFRVTHEDRPENLLGGKNMLANDPATPSYTDPTDLTDEMGHGTFVAGVVAAATDNGLGAAGVAPGAAILPLKCGYRVGKQDRLPLSAVIRGLSEALSAKVDVVNLSLGLPEDSPAMKVAVNRLNSANILMVAAVGNDADGTKNYPAGYNNVVGVGAVDRNGDWATYSNYNSSVWITAPGSALCGLGYTTDTAYIGSWNGTSLAAPCVAGLAAMAKQADKSISVTEFFQLLKLTADHTPNTSAGHANGYSYKYGYGYADAGALAKALVPRVIHYANMDGAPEGTEALMPADKSYNIYEKKDLTLAAPTGEPEGYVFGGWYEDPACQGTAVTAVAPARDGVETADRTYYARWLSSNTDLKAVTLTVDGVEYAGEYSPDAEAYTVYVPNGTQLSEAALTVQPAFPSSTCVVGAPAGQWEVTVTAEDNVTRQIHTVTVDDSNCAPVRKADSPLSAQVSPASLDGKTPAVPFEAPLSDLFEDRDTPEDRLTYTVSGVTVDGEPVEEGAALNLPALAEGTLRYEPSAADAGRTLAMDLTTSDGRFTSQSLHIVLTVGQLPFSPPVLTPDAGVFSTREEDPEHEDLEVELTLYGSTLTGITGPGGELTRESDYILSDNQNMPDGEGLCLPATPKPQKVTLKKEYLSTLSKGEYTLTFRFTGAEESSADYTLTVKAKKSGSSGGYWGWLVSTGGSPGPEPTPTPAPTPEPVPTPVVTKTPGGDFEMTFFGETEDLSVEQLFSQTGGEEDYDTILRTGAVTVRIPSGTLTRESDLKGFLPAAEQPDGTVVVYTDAQGKQTILPLSLVEDGRISYVARGEGTYQVTDNPVTYDDHLPRWVSGAAAFVSSRRLFQGVSASSNRFSPDLRASRATIFTILARLDGQDDTYAHGKQWYEPGLEYCKEQGYTDGRSPQDDITRGELVTLLWRYAGQPETEGSLAEYGDADTVPGYAQEAFVWAVETRLVIGTKDGRLAPGDYATRGEIAVILERFIRGQLPG